MSGNGVYLIVKPIYTLKKVNKLYKYLYYFIQIDK